MSYRWHIRTGLIEQVLEPAKGDITPLYRTVGRGYSGHGDAINDPARVKEHNVGPIPPGLWRMLAPRNHPHLGIYVIPLMPADGTETFGRYGFYIHGENPIHHGASSLGCPVLDLHAREDLGDGIDRGDVLLEVVPE